MSSVLESLNCNSVVYNPLTHVFKASIRSIVCTWQKPRLCLFLPKPSSSLHSSCCYGTSLCSILASGFVLWFHCSLSAMWTSDSLSSSAIYRSFCWTCQQERLSSLLTDWQAFVRLAPVPPEPSDSYFLFFLSPNNIFSPEDCGPKKSQTWEFLETKQC